MKLQLGKIASLLVLSLHHVKKAFAEDPFLANHKRAELFEMIDFKMPVIKIGLNQHDYDRLILGFECERDCSPNFMKRNEKCYTADWVDLNYALKRCLSKEYLPKSNVTKTEDLELIKKVENNSYNITLPEFENLITSYSKFSLEEIFTHPYKLAPNAPNYGYFGCDYKAEGDASMTFTLDGKEEVVKKVKFSVGGRSTKGYGKLGYNIKIKGNKLFHGTKQLRLRAENVDPTFIRDKLNYDLHLRAGLRTLTANYCQLYINDTFMGLFLIRDAFKPQWIEDQYGEFNTTHIFSCDNNDSKDRSVFFNCINDAYEDVKDYVDEDWKHFQELLYASKTREDLEKFFDVKAYMKWQASRYLFGGNDHPTSGQNNMLYMSQNITEAGEHLWIPFLYDFDLNFGSKRGAVLKRSFEEEIVDKTNPIYDILQINGTNPEIKQYMEEIMRDAFNPMIILPRIDQLKTFLDPYVREDRTPDENGHRPGRFQRVHSRVEDIFSYDDFLGNSEFSTLHTKQYYTYDNPNGYVSEKTYLSLKEWTIGRFKYACETYDLDCSFADEFMSTPYANYETNDIYESERFYGCGSTDEYCCVLPETTANSKDENGGHSTENGRACLILPELLKEREPIIPIYDGTCWAKAEGYPCCKETKKIVTTDSKRHAWGMENNEWCGLVKYCPERGSYKCCSKTCSVTYTDSVEWGVESGEWCVLPYSCGANQGKE